MVLLAAVTLVSVGIAGGATLVGATDVTPTRFTERATGYAEPASSPNNRITYVGEQPLVRVVGAPFVPNTNPREQ